jgi:ribose transport system substrate-binding protein
VARLRQLTPVAVAVALALAACGGDDDEPTTPAAGTTTTDGGAAITAPPTTPPDDIKVATELSERPPTGKSVVWLQCELPTCERFTPGFEAATEALGWDLKTVVFKAANPGEGLQQALNLKPDYVAMSGVPSAMMKAQLAAAEKQGVEVFMGSTVERAADSPYATQVAGTLEQDAKDVAAWAISDSGGKAHILGVTVPLYPILATETDWLERDLGAACADCSYTQLDVTVEDMAAGTVGSKIVAQLQSHPDVDYVFLTFNDLGTGVGEALESAGLADKVKIVGAAGDASRFKQVTSGEHAAWSTSANHWDAFAMVDAMARTAVGDELDDAYLEAVYSRPTWVVDGSDASQAALRENDGDWFGPADTAEQFKRLWKVDSDPS